MPFRGRLRAWALVAGVAVAAATTTGRSARAQETSPTNAAAARRHFDKARAFYAQGAYREAIGELEAAHALDPSAKDLVFNLGVVHEKLGDIDEALRWFRLYTTMSLTPQERERADAYVHRLEGAKREVADKQAASAAAQGPPAVDAAPLPPAPPPIPLERPGMSTRDVVTVVAAGVTIAAVAAGTAMGIKAEEDRPPSPYVTGSNGTYADLADGQSNAHKEAIIADIGFTVAAAGAAATAILFFTRPRAAPRAGVSAGPVRGGGAMFVQGSF